MPAKRKRPLWEEMSQHFDIAAVRIVAVFVDRGGAIVEDVERLRIVEGRHYDERAAEDGSLLPILRYDFGFSVPDKPLPLASQIAEARIVITGTHTNCKGIEIRGCGWVGYDNLGHIEGYFEAPPLIFTEHTHFPPSDDDEPLMTDEEFAVHMKTNYPMPAQFTSATRRIRTRIEPGDSDKSDNEGAAANSPSVDKKAPWHKW